jgi:MFS family permease
VRKTFMAIGLTTGGLFLGASVLAPTPMSVLLLMLTGASLGFSTSNDWAITQTLAGPQASGRWTGLQCAFANLSGAVASALTGFLLDRTGHFVAAFALTAAVAFLGALCWIFVVGPVEQVQWREHQAPLVLG